MKKINLIVYDFDGVMTDNKVYIDQNGNEMVKVNRADGLAISEIKKLGIQQIIFSTEVNPVVAQRAMKLQIPYFQGIDNKKDSLIDYCKINDIDIRQVAYVGNDINDIDAMAIAGFPFCPNNSHKSIKEIADVIIPRNGGDGVIRELFDIIKSGD